MKAHLYRSSRSTWCGLVIREHPNIYVVYAARQTQLPYERCKTCMKADAAEQRKEDSQ